MRSQPAEASVTTDREIPPIDTHVPERLQTATFGSG
jgi:hypothetical protein